MGKRRLAAACSIAVAIFCTGNAHAADYYVDSNASGDSGSGSSLSPWRTLNKVNTVALKSNDRVFFRKGGVWEGTLQLRNGVTYGSYPSTSTAAAPLIRTSAYIGGLNWSLHSGNIYVADVAQILRAEKDIQGVEFPAEVSQLIYNGARLQRARYPNIGAGGGKGVFNRGQNRFLRVAEGTPVADDVDAHTLLLEAGAIPAAQGAGDILGAQVYVKNYPWYLTRYNVTEAASTTHISVKADPTWPGTKNYRLTPGNGYWLENKLWMLDKEGEWVFDHATKKLYVWLPAGASPVGKSLLASTRVHGIEGRDVASVSVKEGLHK